MSSGSGPDYELGLMLSPQPYNKPFWALISVDRHVLAESSNQIQVEVPLLLPLNSGENESGTELACAKASAPNSLQSSDLPFLGARTIQIR